MGNVARTFRRTVIGTVAAAITLGGAVACTVPVETRPAITSPGTATGTASPAPAATIDATQGTSGTGGGNQAAAVLAPAGSSAAGIVEIAKAGQTRGTAPEVRTAAVSLLSLGTDLSDALTRADPPVAGTPSADTTAALKDLDARPTTENVDGPWLKAASDALVGTRAAVDAALASPDVSSAVKDAIRQATTGLETLQGVLNDARTAAGASVPTKVEAGDGGWIDGQPLWLTVAGIALVGIGGAMLGGAVSRRRVRR